MGFMWIPCTEKEIFGAVSCIYLYVYLSIYIYQKQHLFVYFSIPDWLWIHFLTHLTIPKLPTAIHHCVHVWKTTNKWEIKRIGPASNLYSTCIQIFQCKYIKPPLQLQFNFTKYMVSCCSFVFGTLFTLGNTSLSSIQSDIPDLHHPYILEWQQQRASSSSDEHNLRVEYTLN